MSHLYLLEKAVKSKYSRVCILRTLHALSMNSVGKTEVFIEPAFVKLWPWSCLFIILLTEILETTLGEIKPKQQNLTTQTQQ